MLALTDTGRVPVYEAISVIGQADEREDAVNDLMQQFGLGSEDAEKLMRTDLNGLVGLGMREDDKGPKGSDPKETFKTSGGRTVHGGGGIAPDVEIKRERRPRIVIEFIRNYLFFDFAVNYAIERKLPTSITDWKPEADIVESFKTFISDTTNTNGYRYVSVAEYRLKELNQSFKDRELSEAETALEQLKLVAKKQGEIEFEESREDILNQIRVAIAEGVWGEQAKQIASLHGDEQFEEAVKILKNQSLYQEKMKLALAGDIE
jgi:carboxyl-terminal processing protease